MGLLTDPNTGAGGASKIVNIIIKYHKIFSWLLYVGGVVFLLGKVLLVHLSLSLNADADARHDTMTHDKI